LKPVFGKCRKKFSGKRKRIYIRQFFRDAGIAKCLLNKIKIEGDTVPNDRLPSQAIRNLGRNVLCFRRRRNIGI